MKTMKIIEVHWVDSRAPFKVWNHKNNDEEYQCSQITSVGFLARRTAKVLTLISSFDPVTDNYGGMLNIPTCAITKIRVIR
jgi:hypothetical protein